MSKHRLRTSAGARARLPAPWRGYWITDDHDSNTDILPNRVKCLVHRLRTHARSDERVSELHEAGELDELRKHLEEEYKTVYKELVTMIGQDHPALWDEENEEFTGLVSTNAIGGGN